MIVRDARPGDGRRFEQVRIAGWHAAYAGILHPELLRGLVVDEERVAWRERWLAAPPPGEVTLVAEADGARKVLPLLGDPVEVRYRRLSPASR